MILNISKEAFTDIFNIEQYLARHFGIRIAKEKIAKLYKDIKILADNPYMGKCADGHDENFRLLSSPPNIILYDVTDTTIEILHVADARTDYMSTFFPDIKQ